MEEKIQLYSITEVAREKIIDAQHMLNFHPPQGLVLDSVEQHSLKWSKLWVKTDIKHIMLKVYSHYFKNKIKFYF